MKDGRPGRKLLLFVILLSGLGKRKYFINFSILLHRTMQIHPESGMEVIKDWVSLNMLKVLRCENVRNFKP